MSSNLNIESTNINAAADVKLTDEQRTIIGSVFDLFAGKPSAQKLALWDDDAIFEDPIAYAQGRKQYEAQWYGLVAAFSEIEPVSHTVTSAGNPITIDVKNRYVVKGINKETTIASVVNIHVNPASGKIDKVQDKWNGKLPDGSIQNVSRLSQLLSPLWWAAYAQAWAFWAWSFVWYTRPWMAFRRLNAATMPKVVSVPQSEEEDAKKTL